MERKLGWKRDLPDTRDYRLVIAPRFDLPKIVDLRPKMPAVYDQGSLGSCTAQAIAANVQYAAKFQVGEKLNNQCPSRLFIYYNERVMEGTVNEDSGAYIRDGIKSINRQGVVAERFWPYKPERFAERPPQSVYDKAARELVRQYARISQDVDSLKTCLATRGPVVFGFSVFSKFLSAEVARTGVLGMPGRNESEEGGHAVLLVGYNDLTRSFIVRNSWGKAWGMKGYFTMPYDYVSSPALSDDFWHVSFI